jgi:hypothetical protein
MERETGIEPATSSLGSWRSTAELLPLRRHDDFSAGKGKVPVGSSQLKERAQNWVIAFEGRNMQKRMLPDAALQK